MKMNKSINNKLLASFIGSQEIQQLAVMYGFTNELRSIETKLAAPVLSEQEYKVSFILEDELTLTYTLYHSNMTELSDDEIRQYSYDVISKHNNIDKTLFYEHAMIEVLSKTDASGNPLPLVLSSKKGENHAI